MGPLLFLKIEGERHFFPPSYSFISCNLMRFLVSFSVGSPFLSSKWRDQDLQSFAKDLCRLSNLMRVFFMLCHYFRQCWELDLWNPVKSKQKEEYLLVGSLESSLSNWNNLCPTLSRLNVKISKIAMNFNKPYLRFFSASKGDWSLSSGRAKQSQMIPFVLLCFNLRNPLNQLL
jgi:hypothetical protein